MYIELIDITLWLLILSSFMENIKLKKGLSLDFVSLKIEIVLSNLVQYHILKGYPFSNSPSSIRLFGKFHIFFLIIHMI
jgi:hypothetical protein